MVVKEILFTKVFLGIVEFFEVKMKVSFVLWNNTNYSLISLHCP